MAFRLVQRIRTVMLMVPMCPESGSLDVALLWGVLTGKQRGP